MPEQPAQTLPEGFNGTFYFTNYTDSDFVDKWDSIEYTFPARKTVPLIIPSETPLGVQEIRKKFARNLAIKVFYESDKYKVRESEAPAGSGKIPAIFTEADLAPYIQKCLEPLPLDMAKAEVKEKESTERNLRTDERGRRRTKVIVDGEDLLQGAQVIA